MSRVFWIICSIGLLILVFFALGWMEDTIDIVEKEQEDYRPKISVVAVQITAHAGTIRTLAEVKPRWSATLKAHVDGEVIEVSEKAMAGEQIEKNDVLVRIEDSAYKANLAEARRSLAEANLVLLQEQSKTEQALLDWERSGLKTKPSVIALNKPQLDIAEKTVASAQANIIAAEKRSIYTTVTAPFSGIVTERFISIGQTVNIGDQLLSVLNQSKLDITVSLNSNQWKNLAESWSQLKADVKNAEEQVVAIAKIKRGGGFLDPQSRQHKLFLEIENNETNQALAGEFVNIELPGRSVTNTILIPASVFTREGTVWFVDATNRLRYFDSKIVFYQGDNLIVTVPEDFDNNEVQVVLSPLASFVAGKEIIPVFTESN